MPALASGSVDVYARLRVNKVHLTYSPPHINYYNVYYALFAGTVTSYYTTIVVVFFVCKCRLKHARGVRT